MSILARHDPAYGPVSASGVLLTSTVYSRTAPSTLRNDAVQLTALRRDEVLAREAAIEAARQLPLAVSTRNTDRPRTDAHEKSRAALLKWEGEDKEEGAHQQRSRSWVQPDGFELALVEEQDDVEGQANSPPPPIASRGRRKRSELNASISVDPATPKYHHAVERSLTQLEVERIYSTVISPSSIPVSPSTPAAAPSSYAGARRRQGMPLSFIRSPGTISLSSTSRQTGPTPPRIPLSARDYSQRPGHGPVKLKEDSAHAQSSTPAPQRPKLKPLELTPASTPGSTPLPANGEDESGNVSPGRTSPCRFIQSHFGADGVGIRAMRETEGSFVLLAARNPIIKSPPLSPRLYTNGAVHNGSNSTTSPAVRLRFPAAATSNRPAPSAASPASQQLPSRPTAPAVLLAQQQQQLAYLIIEQQRARAHLTQSANAGEIAYGLPLAAQSHEADSTSNNDEPLLFQSRPVAPTSHFVPFVTTAPIARDHSSAPNASQQRTVDVFTSSQSSLAYAALLAKLSPPTTRT